MLARPPASGRSLRCGRGSAAPSGARPRAPASRRDAPSPAPRRRRAAARARSRIAAPSTCGIRAAGVPGAGAEREDVQPGQPARLDEIERALRTSPRSRSGSPAMMSAPRTISGRAARTALAEGDGVVAEVPPLHPLQDQVVARLQRQVQVRHQPRLAGDRLDRAAGPPRPSRSRRAAAAAGPAPPRGSPPPDRRAAPPPSRSAPQLVRSTPVSTTSLKPRSTSRRDLLDHRGGRHAARVPPPVGDDAEGAAVVAAVLHLHVGPRPGAEPVDQRRRRPRARP